YHWPTFFPDFASWLGTTRSRVVGWGFNTAGAGSLPPRLLRLPVIPNLDLGLTARFHWVDPFDPAAERRLRAWARRLVAPYRGDPYRIGYFTDNEVGWWSGALFDYYAKQRETNRTKQRLVALLREHYADGWVARYYFDGLRQLTGGKPVLISEWFFAAEENRSGNRNNGHLMTVGTQAERARGAAAAAERFARQPTIVGSHWFQYYDHPRGGREDGE